MCRGWRGVAHEGEVDASAHAVIVLAPKRVGQHAAADKGREPLRHESAGGVRCACSRSLPRARSISSSFLYAQSDGGLTAATV